ncbi:MAG: PAS domain-containing protein, partial [Candidatus Erginobacter occultus]|nr:PAS domain-containing protein [Candidatus Erginobacter occultus]
MPPAEKETVAGQTIPTRDDLLREIARLKRELEAPRRTDRKLIDDVLNTIQDGISILEPDLTVRHVNPVMREWYRPNLPLEGKKCYQVYHNRKRPCSPCPVLRSFKSGRTEVDIVPGLPGSPAEWIELFAYPRRDPATGEITGVVEFVRDITERKRAEDDFRTEHAQLLSIFDSIDQVIYVVDPDTYEILFANRALTTRVGHPVVGKTCYREFQGLDRPCDFCTNEIIRKLDGQPYYWEYHNPNLDRDYQIIDRLIKWSDGRDVRFELAIDITERKRAEISLRESADKYRQLSSLLETIFNTIPDLLGVQDPDRKIIRYNQAGYDILGFKPEEAAGKKCYQLLGREEPCPVCATTEALRTGKPARVEKFVEEMGLWFDCRAYPVLDGEGQVVQVIEHLRDITERKRLEEERRELERQVQQAQKLESLGVLAGGIAHDFNNILMVVLGNAELALESVPAYSPARMNLEQVTRAVRQAADLCRQMFAYTGKSSFTRRAVDLKSLVEEIAHLLKTSISKKAVLNLQLADELPT